MKYATYFIAIILSLSIGKLAAQQTDRKMSLLQKIKNLLEDSANAKYIYIAELRPKTSSDPSGGKYGDFIVARDAKIAYSSFRKVSGSTFNDSSAFSQDKSAVVGCSFVPRFILTTSEKSADVILFSPDCKQLGISSASFRQINHIVDLSSNGSNDIENKFMQLLSPSSDCKLTLRKIELFFTSNKEHIKKQIIDQGFEIECEGSSSFMIKNVPQTTERSFKKLFETWPGVDSAKIYSRALSSAGPIVITVGNDISIPVLKKKCEEFCKTYFKPGTFEPIKSGHFFAFFEIVDLRNRIFKKKNYYERIKFSFFLGLSETHSEIVIEPSIYVAGGLTNPPPSAYSLADDSLSKDSDSFLQAFVSSLETHLKK